MPTKTTSGRKWATAQTAFSRTATCKSQVACDGQNLASPARIEKGVCAKCEQTLAKRQGKAK